MRKLRLEVSDLTVETFSPTSGPVNAAGTVHGATGDDVWTSPCVCPSVQTGQEGCMCQVSGNLSCVGCPSDTESCFQSCAATDGGSICLNPC
jgi:hypothetical protein